MTNVVGVVAFALALIISVMLHEAGHFVTARRFGMKASKFFVGFGTTLWSTKRGETEYGIKAIPAGGFVKIEGMTALEEIDPADADRAFYKQPAPQRVIVLAAGSFMHFVIALALIYGVVLALGTQKLSENAVGATSCVPATATATCTSVGPAKAAGIRPDDTIVSFDGTAVTSWDQFTQLVRDHGAGVATVVVNRGGKDLTLRPDLVAVKRDKATGAAGNDTVGAIGLARRIDNVSYNPLSAVPRTGQTLGLFVTGTYDSVVHRFGEIGTLFSKNRSPNSFVSVVGAARAGGELLSTPKISLGQRIGDFLVLVAGVNLAIGLFNLLPLFPLDGGHIAVLVFEQARQGVRRVFGYRGAVKRVDMVKLMPATYAVVAALIVLSVLVLSADIINPIRINQ